MRDFSDTFGADVEVTEESQYDETNWLPAETAKQYNALRGVSANIGPTVYGVKAFVHCFIEGDPEGVEYTISFTERSIAYQQLRRVIDQQKLHMEGKAEGLPEEAQIESPFPFLFRVTSVGRTFALAGSLASNPAPAPTPQVPAASPRNYRAERAAQVAQDREVKQKRQADYRKEGSDPGSPF